VAAPGRRAQAAGGELDDDRRPLADADVLPAREAAGAATQVDEREADEARVAAGLLRPAALGHVDEAVGLGVVDGERWALAQDERADRPRLGLRPRLVAVDLADDEDLARRVRVAQAREDDRAMLDGVADDRAGQCGGQGRDHRRSASVVTTAS
jgi:hypothetical protein